MKTNIEDFMDIENMSKEQLVAALRAQQDDIGSKIVVKVSPKGCVQVNGIRRFPLSFYKNEWAIIFSLQERIEQFIKDNDSKLAAKGE